MIKIVCLALFITLASAKITYKDCSKGEVKDVEVSGCDQSPCTFTKGKQVTITATFVANQDSKTAKVELDAKVGELEIQVPGLESDGCKFMSCPVKKGESKTIKYVLTVPTTVPAVEADITVKLTGDNGVMACGSTHGFVKD